MKNNNIVRLQKGCNQFRFLIWVIVFVLLGLTSSNLDAQNRKIALFGSSVANASGDTTGAGGYAGSLTRLLSIRGWEVVNISRGGDNTTKILQRFETQLLPAKPKYVIIGLSLGNEGIMVATELARNRAFEKYRSGLFNLIRLCRLNELYPIVAGCYARNDFQPQQYEATRRMNLIINTWDVPSINMLGPIDNGKGNWLEGYYHDKSHPDFKGHREMYFAIVPSLFEAIEAGKPVPSKIRSTGYVSIKKSDNSGSLSFIPDDTIHSWSISFLVRTIGQGTVAAINPGKHASAIEITGGKIKYQSVTESVLENDTTSENKAWQYIVVTHQYASGTTTFYSNGKEAGTLSESIDFKEFVLGGYGNAKSTSAPDEAGFKDLFIYRSVLNYDEVKALYYDQLIQSSLEVYAPLNDDIFKPGEPVKNLAQSMSKLICRGANLVPVK